MNQLYQDQPAPGRGDIWVSGDRGMEIPVFDQFWVYPAARGQAAARARLGDDHLGAIGQRR
jgi:hypothetical protein